jgi:hypothetical protein
LVCTKRDRYRTFELVSSTKYDAVFKRKCTLENYSGIKFDLTVERVIRLLDKASINTTLGIAVPQNVQAVAFESVNSIINKGQLHGIKKQECFPFGY